MKPVTLKLAVRKSSHVYALISKKIVRGKERHRLVKCLVKNDFESARKILQHHPTQLSKRSVNIIVNAAIREGMLSRLWAVHQHLVCTAVVSKYEVNRAKLLRAMVMTHPLACFAKRWYELWWTTAVLSESEEQQLFKAALPHLTPYGALWLLQLDKQIEDEAAKRYDTRYNARECRRLSQENREMLLNIILAGKSYGAAEAILKVATEALEKKYDNSLLLRSLSPEEEQKLYAAMVHGAIADTKRPRYWFTHKARGLLESPRARTLLSYEHISQLQEAIVIAEEKESKFINIRK